MTRSFADATPRITHLPVRMKATHVLSRYRGAFRVHRIRDAHSLYLNGNYSHSTVHAVCGVLISESRAALGSAEQFVAQGYVLCPFCHRCRCAYPCQVQCICSTRCDTCDPQACNRMQRRTA